MATTIRKNSKLVAEILANDSLKVDKTTDQHFDSTMSSLRADFNNYKSYVSVYKGAPNEINFHFHSNLHYTVNL
jgi:hypothetical protein